MFRRIALALVAMAALAGVCQAAAARQPNIVLIMVDDFGYECVTANGGQSYQTPNLDRLAAEGMRFEHCYVQPLCTPTRVQLMTGQYNVRNYVQFGLLDPRQTTFGHLLKQAGYVTGIAGKWQLGREADLPQKFGFDESFLWQHTRRPPRFANPGLEHNGKELDYANGEYGPLLVNDFALDFVARHKDRPFMLYYPMILTHNPFQPTPDSPDYDKAARGEDVNRNNKYFADMTAYMDKMVGRLVARLAELGLREQTLVLFLGDNGTNTGITSQFKGQPYKGGKGRGDARGMHVPMIANWPGKISPGQVNRDLVASTDFLPTLCEAAGTKVPSTPTLDGQSFLPQLLGQGGQPRKTLYCWYARDGGPTASVEFAMSRAHKLHKDGRFFDLTSDPFEERPLAVDKLTGADAAAAKALQAELDRYATARPAELQKPAARAAKADGTAKKKKKKQK
jgi:arylsulfatase A